MKLDLGWQNHHSIDNFLNFHLFLSKFLSTMLIGVGNEHKKISLRASNEKMKNSHSGSRSGVLPMGVAPSVHLAAGWTGNSTVAGEPHASTTIHPDCWCSYKQTDKDRQRQTKTEKDRQRQTFQTFYGYFIGEEIHRPASQKNWHHNFDSQKALGHTFHHHQHHHD